MLSLFDTTARSLLILIFAVAVLSKVRKASAFSDFRSSTQTLTGVSWRQASWLAAATVIAEVLAMVFLLIESMVTAGYLLAAALLVSFSIVVVSSIRHGRETACRCFGAQGGAITIVHGMLNLALAVVALSAALLQVALPATVNTASGTVLGVGAALLLATLFVQWPQVVFLLRQPALGNGRGD